jgi:hypothetical protein
MQGSALCPPSGLAAVLRVMRLSDAMRCLRLSVGLAHSRASPVVAALKRETSAPSVPSHAHTDVPYERLEPPSDAALTDFVGSALALE